MTDLLPGKKFLSADEILAADDIHVVEVNILEWGGIVRLRPLSGEEASAFVDTLGGDKKDSLVMAVMLSVVDDKGNHLFGEQHVPMLKKKSMRALLRVQETVLEINGLSKGEEAKTKNG